MSKPVVTVQRAFRAKYAKDPPTDETIREWYKQFTEPGWLCKQKAPILTGMWQELEYRIEDCRVARGAKTKQLKLKKKNFFSFPVAVNNSIKVGPLIFLL
jgi:hypothetical protein